VLDETGLASADSFRPTCLAEVLARKSRRHDCGVGQVFQVSDVAVLGNSSKPIPEHSLRGRIDLAEQSALEARTFEPQLYPADPGKEPDCLGP